MIMNSQSSFKKIQKKSYCLMPIQSKLRDTLEHVTTVNVGSLGLGKFPFKRQRFSKIKGRDN